MWHNLLPALFLLCVAAAFSEAGAAQKGKDRADHYSKWLSEDVAYIMSDAEREVFGRLTNDQEREAFVEEFWRRRDPNPSTAANEFREEHYRRIAHANQNFAAGIPGWRTDRGKIYILHGPPDSIESMPMGGIGDRPMDEGGGSTAFHPFEVWHYRYLEGVGENLRIEFVNRKGGGLYELARDPYDKDALFYVPNSGLTLLELTDYGEKADRVRDRYLNNPSTQDPFRPNSYGKAFEQLQQKIDLLKPPAPRARELRGIISARTSFDPLPIEVRQWQFQAWEDAYFVPVSVLIPRSAMKGGDVQFYGRVETLNQKVVLEFEETVRPREVPGAGDRSVLQKKLPLRSGRYKATVLVREPSTGKAGLHEFGIVLETPDHDRIGTSEIILAEEIHQVATEASKFEDSTISGHEITPRVTGAYRREDQVKFYLEIYRALPDGSHGNPEVTALYRIGPSREGAGWTDISASLRSWGDRLVLIHHVPVWALDGGEHILQVKILDRVAEKEVLREVPFSVSVTK